MFYVTYMFSELRRRKGRTLLTALGLAVGIGLVVAVSSLSRGLDAAQAKVLEPLTGVGTEMTVTRPVTFTPPDEDSSGGTVAPGGPGGFGGGLSDEERSLLEKENGSSRLGLQNLGEPGTTFSRDTFMTMSQLSFPATNVTKVAGLAGVESAVGGLTLNSIHVSGTVPEQADQGQGRFGGPPQDGRGGGPSSIDFNAMTVSGVDQSSRDLGAITADQVTRGRWLSDDSSREVILDVNYASSQGLALGDSVKLGGKSFEVVGIAKTPLGGAASDVYVKLAQLQKLSDRVGRVNTVYVRATSAKAVTALARHITNTFEGASVTTAKDLADRVSGSLVDAKNLTRKLGLALAVVGLTAAFLIAILLTLSSVGKRVRELGTLKAVGWPQRLVVRQVTGEALLQGLLGGLIGVILGVAAATAITVFGPDLQATVSSALSAGPRFGPPGLGPTTADQSTTVPLDAPISVSLILLAVGLAMVGGLLAGAVGGMRAVRLRPADALRHID